MKKSMALETIVPTPTTGAMKKVPIHNPLASPISSIPLCLAKMLIEFSIECDLFKSSKYVPLTWIVAWVGMSRSFDVLTTNLKSALLPESRADNENDFFPSRLISEEYTFN